MPTLLVWSHCHHIDFFSWLQWRGRAANNATGREWKLQGTEAIWSVGSFLTIGDNRHFSPEPEEQDHGRTSSALPSSPHTLTVTEPLTRREREVLRFLAQGLTSSQISQELTIKVYTVNTHIRSIYTKLNITTRSAATRYALEHQLLWHQR